MVALFQTPEMPVGETWEWRTDVMVSDNGTEQRVELLQYPKRNFEMSYRYSEEADLRRDLPVFFKMGSPLDLPLFQYQTRLKAKPAMGATVLQVVNSKNELRDRYKCYIFDTLGGEIRTIDALTSSAVTLTAGLSRAYAARSWVCPVADVHTLGRSGMNRLNPDYAATAELKLRELAFTVPFINPFHDATLTMLDGLPVLEFRPIGREFDTEYDTGVEVTDFGGVVAIRDPWLHAQEVWSRRFLCQRTLEPDSFERLKAFADYAKGDCNPFYVPAYRDDFDVHTPPVGAGNTLKLTGLTYLNEYWPKAPYKSVAIYSDAGVHYARVTACVDSAGNSQLTLNPPLPAGSGWDQNTSVTLLIKSRIAGDKVSCYHYPLHTEFELALRTVDA